MQMSLHAISCLHVRYVSHATYLLHYMSSVMDKLYLIHIIISIFITHISHNFIHSTCYSIYNNNTHYPFSAINPAMLGLGNNLDLVQNSSLYQYHTKHPTHNFLLRPYAAPSISGTNRFRKQKFQKPERTIPQFSVTQPNVQPTVWLRTLSY